jgi:imidazolonepropionase-like amidohydrolase
MRSPARRTDARRDLPALLSIVDVGPRLDGDVEAGVQLAPAVIDKAHSVVERHRAAFRSAVQAGVRIAMGTD